MPDDLSARMDRLSDRVNWSGVAQAAFEAEIRLYPDWKDDRMSAVIERLRASKQKSTSDDLRWGVEAGRKWAEEQAEFKDLRRLASQPDPDDDDEFDIDDMWRLLDTEMELTRTEFWENILGMEAQHWSSAFQVGFIRGAKAVWEEVEDKL